MAECPSEYAECPPHDRQCISGAGHRLRLHMNRAGFAWDDREAAGSALRLAKAQCDEAVKLLERVLHLRMNGERAPGGNETWQDSDRDVEAYLRKAHGM